VVCLDGMLELGHANSTGRRNENQEGTVLEFESARSRTRKILSIPEAMLIATSIPPLASLRQRSH